MQQPIQEAIPGFISIDYDQRCQFDDWTEGWTPADRRRGTRPIPFKSCPWAKDSDSEFCGFHKHVVRQRAGNLRP